MKKILFILHLPPPVHGAAMVGQYVKESKTINKTFDCRYINLGTSRTVDEIGKNPFAKVGRYLAILWQVVVQLIRFRPDLCYLTLAANPPGFYKDTLVVLLVKLFGVKLVYHFHNKGVKAHQDNNLDNFLYRRVFKNTNAILLSKHLYSDVEKYFPENKVHYCPNGIPDLAANQTQKATKPHKKVEILFLSNLIESKGVTILLEACQILRNKEIPFRCTFVGGEGDITVSQFQQKIQQMDLSQHVFYAGKKYAEEKNEVFKAADIFAFPTHYPNECFPLVLLEAMQHRLPVVSTFEGGIPDIVQDGITGLLVPQSNATALADKLELLIKNAALREQMGAAGYKKYEEAFTLEHFENRLTTILKESSNNT